MNLIRFITTTTLTFACVSFSTASLAGAAELRLSQTGQRGHSEPLNGQSVGPGRTLSISLDDAGEGIKKVTFFVNGVQTPNPEYHSPYDMYGTNINYSPGTVSSDSFSVGQHEIMAVVDYFFGSDDIITATFERRPALIPPTASADYDFSAVEAILNDAMEEEDINGIGLVIVDKVKGLVFESYRGVQGPDRISVLASTSKMIAAGVLAHLEDQGTLDLESPVSNVIDWGPTSQSVTPAQMISNSSGFPGIGLDFFGTRCQIGADDSLLACGEEIFRDVSPVSEPDEKYRYGGVQWQAAGAVAEVASGKSWATLINEIYSVPCGLDTLGFGNPYELVNPFEPDTLLTFDSASVSIGAPYPKKFYGNPSNLTPTSNPLIEGGGYSNARDYGKLLLMHLRGGVCDNGQVLSQAALNKLHADRIQSVYDGISGDDNGYGMGWFVERDDSNIIYDPGAFGALAWLDLADEYGAFLIMEDTEAPRKRISPDLLTAIDAAMNAL